MIELTVQGSHAKPVVTTTETIKSREEFIAKLMAPIVMRLFDVVEKICGIMPGRITVTVEWVDGSVTEAPLPQPHTKVPSWMS